MPTATLLKLAGISAVIAGGLRIVGAFVPETVPLSAREPLYIFTDIFILFALFGLYARIHREAGWIGLCGFVLGVLGIGVILTPGATIAGVPIYPIRAGTFLAGLNLIALASWKQALLPRWILTSWALSAIAGIAGFGGASQAVVVAGVIFGIGFSAMGVWLTHSRLIPGNIPPGCRPKRTHEPFRSRTIAAAVGCRLP